MSGVRIPPPRPYRLRDATEGVGSTPRQISAGSPEPDLMVAVAHQVEHRIVAPEVAGSRPVSHPIPHPFLVRAALGLCVAPRNQRRKSPARLIMVFRVVQGVADRLAQPSCPK
jgi:hypothetical protein